MVRNSTRYTKITALRLTSKNFEVNSKLDQLYLSSWSWEEVEFDTEVLMATEMVKFLENNDGLLETITTLRLSRRCRAWYEEDDDEDNLNKERIQRMLKTILRNCSSIVELQVRLSTTFRLILERFIRLILVCSRSSWKY